MNKTTEKHLSKSISHGFVFDNGTSLTPDEMKIIERYGFLFSNGMLLTPNELEIIKNFKIFM